MGEAKKKKFKCPVVGRVIKPVECGENRCSKYECPSDCPQNPWSPVNYGLALEINDRYMEKILSRLRAENIARYGYPKAPPLGEDSGEFAFLQWFSGQFFRERDADGRTFEDRWESEGYRGLNNDQRVMFQAEAKMYPAVLEIQQIPDEQSVIAVDLLDPEGKPLLAFDRSLASSACRFTTLFAVVYQMPHYMRIHSAAVPLPEIPGMPMCEVFTAIMEHLGTPKDPSARNAWLMENLQRMVDSIRAVSSARFEAMIRGLDASYTKAVFELRCTPEKFGKVLEEQDDMELEDVLDDDKNSGFLSEWICLGGESPAVQGRVLVGRILLHADGYVQLEASSESRTQQLKERVGGLFGSMLEFSRERTDDIAEQLLEKRTLIHDSALVPESLLQNTQQVETTTARIPVPKEEMSKKELEAYAEQGYMSAFLENEVPALDGLTPRQAANDPAMRPRLVELMKSHVRSHDENNLRTGRSTDINWMLVELGLDEINYPPPPQREPAEGYDDDDYNEGDSELDEDPLYVDEEFFAERMEELAEFGEAELQDFFAETYPDIRELVVDLCRDQGLDYVQPRLLQMAAEVSHILLDPRPALHKTLDCDLVLNHASMLLENSKELNGDDFLDSLNQPLIAVRIGERLKELLRFGKNDPAYAQCWFLLVAISEAADDVVYTIMSAALERNQPE